MPAKQPNNTEETRVLPLAEESLNIAKRDVSRGKVRVRTVVDTIDEVVRASLEGERVEITRVPIGTPVDAPPPVRTQDGVTIIPIVEEVLFVEKRLVVSEELHIRRRVETETVEVPIAVRKERAVVDSLPPQPTTKGNPADE